MARHGVVLDVALQPSSLLPLFSLHLLCFPPFFSLDLVAAQREKKPWRQRGLVERSGSSLFMRVTRWHRGNARSADHPWWLCSEGGVEAIQQCRARVRRRGARIGWGFSLEETFGGLTGAHRLGISPGSLSHRARVHATAPCMAEGRRKSHRHR
jgi:hypothetical protein